MKEVKATGKDEMPQTECVEGENKAENEILEMFHVKGGGNAQRGVKDVGIKKKKRRKY